MKKKMTLIMLLLLLALSFGLIACGDKDSDKKTVTVFISDFQGSLAPQTVNIGDEFVYEGGNPALDYTWKATVFEENSEFTLAKKYDFIDISALVEPSDPDIYISIIYDENYYQNRDNSLLYYYLDQDTQLSYHYTVYKNGFSLLGIYDEFETLAVYRIFDRTVYIEVYTQGESYCIIDTDGDRVVYQRTDDYVKLESNFIISEENCYNGVMFLSFDWVELKSDYLEINFFYEYGFYKGGYVRVEEEFTLPTPYADGVDFECTVSLPVRIDYKDIDFAFKYPNLEELREYEEYFSDNWFDIGNNINCYVATDEEGFISYVACSMTIDDSVCRFDLWFKEEKITEFRYSVQKFDGNSFDYTVFFDDEGNVTLAIIWQEKPFTDGKISQELFEQIKDLGYNWISITLSAVGESF